jgi:hypothetical protein
MIDFSKLKIGQRVIIKNGSAHCREFNPSGKIEVEILRFLGSPLDSKGRFCRFSGKTKFNDINYNYVFNEIAEIVGDKEKVLFT